jgi:hypothetical protein
MTLTYIALSARAISEKELLGANYSGNNCTTSVNGRGAR